MGQRNVTYIRNMLRLQYAREYTPPICDAACSQITLGNLAVVVNTLS